MYNSGAMTPPTAVPSCARPLTRRRLRRCARVAAACLLALAAGCATGRPAAVGSPTLLAVPLVRQANSFSCGAAALMSVLYYYQRYDGREVALYERLGTTERDGTHPARIVAGARAFGLRAELRQGVSVAALRAALARREPVIVNLQAWTDDPRHVNWRDAWEDGHYVVAVGIDAARLYVMDPSTAGGYAYVPLAELPDRWHDYEEVDGHRVEYHRMAIFVSGPAPATEYPRAPIRME